MRLRDLSQALLAGETASVELLHVAYETKTRTRIDVEQLESMTIGSRCVFSMSTQEAKALVTILDDVVLDPRQGEIDLRWGVRFLDGRDVVRYAIYFDGRSIGGTGRHALMGGVTFDVQGRFVPWLESSLKSKCPTLPL